MIRYMIRKFVVIESISLQVSFTPQQLFIYEILQPSKQFKKLRRRSSLLFLNKLALVVLSPVSSFLNHPHCIVSLQVQLSSILRKNFLSSSFSYVYLLIILEISQILSKIRQTYSKL